jgi:ubiquinol-cytochrome c reductase cytochrome b subunit
MWKLVDFKDYEPTLARPNKQGKITVAARIRASLSRFYFEDRIAPVTKGELDAAHHDHAPAVDAQAPAAKAVTEAKKAPAKKVAAKK